MIYDQLSSMYDALVKDDEATQAYVDFVERYRIGSSFLELACGSGELSIALAKLGYVVDASDISEAMLHQAAQKQGSELLNFFTLDMRNVPSDKAYDHMLCFCDSMNYLEPEELLLMFQSVYHALHEKGVFMFDMHSRDRLDEFSEEFYEAGVIENQEYTWSIYSDENRLYHNFVFYDAYANATYEQHMQYVFAHEAIQKLLQEVGFEVEVYTDFTKQGIHPGEKYFYVARKV
ncbi:MAG: class I SAM-dependent DNA methyltransferase [Breznakia sp.]